MPVVACSSECQSFDGRPLGVGVLGCADIALRRFLPAVVRSDRARLVAIAGRDEQKVEGVARRFACSAMDYDGLLSSEQVDLVYIPLPNALHEEWVMRALDHGKHVLCEKPLGLTPQSVNRMLDTATRNGLLLYENIMYLQHPQHGQIKEMLADGRIGTLSGLNCVFTIPGPAPANFRLDPQQGGGAFHDLNRYPLSAARFFLHGEIVDIIRCDAEWQKGMIMSLAAEARTSANECFTFTIAFGQPYRSFYEISGTNGKLRLERAFTSPADQPCRLEICRDDSMKTVYMPAHDHFLMTLDHIAELIVNGRDFSNEHEQCFLLAQVADRFLQLAQKQGWKS